MASNKGVSSKLMLKETYCKLLTTNGKFTVDVCDN